MWERASMRSTSSRPRLRTSRQGRFGSRFRNSRGLRRRRRSYGQAVREGIRRSQDDIVVRAEAANDLNVRAVVVADLDRFQNDAVVRIHGTDGQASAAEQ